MKREVTLVASGDLREAANRLGWPAQAELERNVTAAFGRHGATVRRAHLYVATRDVVHGLG